MKTNHQRGFKDSGSFRDKSMNSWYKLLPVGLGVVEANICNDFVNGHRGHARACSGAKKYVRTRFRRSAYQHIKIELEGDEI